MWVGMKVWVYALQKVSSTWLHFVSEGTRSSSESEAEAGKKMGESQD